MTRQSRFYFGNYDVGSQSANVWLELGDDATFELREDVQPFAGSSFLLHWQGTWTETEAAVTLRFDHGDNKQHRPGSTLRLARRGGTLVYYDGDPLILLAPSAAPANWQRWQPSDN